MPPTKNPTNNPTRFPTTSPTGYPTTGYPTKKPTQSPTNPTRRPTSYPTAPTRFPTNAPTMVPTTKNPTQAPTMSTCWNSYNPDHCPKYFVFMQSNGAAITSTNQVSCGAGPCDAAKCCTNLVSTCDEHTTNKFHTPYTCPTGLQKKSNAGAKVCRAENENPTWSHLVACEGLCCEPTVAPTGAPTVAPTTAPTGAPTGTPTDAPTTATCESFQCPADYKTLVPCPGPLCKTPCPTTGCTQQFCCKPDVNNCDDLAANACPGGTTGFAGFCRLGSEHPQLTLQPCERMCCNPTVAPTTGTPTDAPTVALTGTPTATPTDAPTALAVCNPQECASGNWGCDEWCACFAAFPSLGTYWMAQTGDNFVGIAEGVCGFANSIASCSCP